MFGRRALENAKYLEALIVGIGFLGRVIHILRNQDVGSLHSACLGACTAKFKPCRPTNPTAT